MFPRRLTLHKRAVLFLIILNIFVLSSVIIYQKYCEYSRKNVFGNLNLNLGRWDNQRKYKIFDNFLVGKRYISLNYLYKTCLATQGSLDKLSSLIDIGNHWNGSISLATFAASEEELNALLLYISYIRKCYEKIYDQVSFHLIIDKGRLENTFNIDTKKLWKIKCINTTEDLLSLNLKNKTDSWRKKLSYPQNHLRNLARKNCQSDYVFLTDIDVIPCQRMAEKLDKFLIKKKNKEKEAYVVATFEIDIKVKFPRNKIELLRLVKNRFARSFHSEVFGLNQKASNITRWQQMKDSGSDVHISHPANKKLFLGYYEPFYISSDNVPPHDERFIGYGYTRNTQVYETIAAGYKFLVLSPIFACHWGLQVRSSRPSWREKQVRINSGRLKKFKQEIMLRYPQKQQHSTPIKNMTHIVVKKKLTINKV